MTAMKIKALFLVLLFVGVSMQLESCKPRASRSKTKKTTPTAQQQQATQPSMNAAQVMSHTDSVLAKVSALSREERDVPQVMPNDYPPRTPWGAPYVPRPDLSEYGTFEAGLASFNSGDYSRAIGAFSQIAVSGRPPELVPNAYYWIGESYYAMNRFSEALPYFEYTTKAGSPYKRETSFYKMAVSNKMLGNMQAATLWGERLRAEYPKSSYNTKLRKMGIRS